MSDRRAAIKACLGEKGGFEGSISGLASDTAGYFKAFYETQWMTTPAGERVNMFDYIMLSQLHAFDYADQQLVLNAFYGEAKAPSEGPFDADNESDCRRFRPAREDDVASGNICSPKTPKGVDFEDVNR